MRDRDQKRKKMHKGCTQNEILNSNLPAHPLSPATSIPSSPAQSVPSLSSPSDELVNGGYLLAAQTNESMVRNAIRYLCLPGQINSSLCLEVLEVLDAVSRQYSTSKVEIPLRFAVLVRGPSAPSYRALYCMDVENPSKVSSAISVFCLCLCLCYCLSNCRFAFFVLESTRNIYYHSSSLFSRNLYF